MGIMVGGEHNGAAFGIAPKVKWIAVKIFNDLGSSDSVHIHQGFQWLRPGYPTTADAPHVVNNYGPLACDQCNLTFQADLQALRAPASAICRQNGPA
jgi:hypothetical protein